MSLSFFRKYYFNDSIMIPFSVLDLSPIVTGDTPTQALQNTLDLAQHAEQWGYTRFWLAEHHNMIGIASAATSVVVGYVAGGTKTIRVGSGGIMLPNHAPLVIAEQFGTLASLYPGRIDLGVGRAPGSDGYTSRALRRDPNRVDTFPEDILELQHYFQPAKPGQLVRAVPGAGLTVPIWVLGSSLFGAQVAATLGLPYVFASHFAPDYLMQAIDLYRSEFRASATLSKPYVMLGLNVVAADTDAEAKWLFTSQQQQFLNIRRGISGQLAPPVDSIDSLWSSAEQAVMAHTLRYSVVGSPETVEEDLTRFMIKTRPNELIITTTLFDHQARLHSYYLTAQVHEKLVSRFSEELCPV